MRFNTLPTITVIKKEEKEATLKSFIANHIAQVAANGEAQQSDRGFLLIARSHESPVVRALASALAEAGNQEFGLKALILLPSADGAPAWPAALASVADYRTLPDVRLLDAHEQLWLDSTTVWIGDCMRREPSKRDAYECYATGCEMTAKFVEHAFNGMWEKGCGAAADECQGSIVIADEIDPHLAHVPSGETAGPTAATRH